jgi:membrane protein CcdC involved in cytochrome C biogenesis
VRDRSRAVSKDVAFMRIAVSLVLLAAGLIILVTPVFGATVNEGLQKIAAGWIGAIIGYWLA